MMRLRFHHFREEPTSGLNQLFGLYRPFTGRGIGIVILRHEFSVILTGNDDGR